MKEHVYEIAVEGSGNKLYVRQPDLGDTLDSLGDTDETYQVRRSDKTTTELLSMSEFEGF